MSELAQRSLLRVTGAVTMLAVLQALAPALYMQTNGIAVSDPAGLLYARHWGLMAFVVGGLLVWAAARPVLRVPIVTAALIEKVGLVVLVVAGLSEPAVAGFRAAACFDGVCVILYSILLYSHWRRVS